MADETTEAPRYTEEELAQQAKDRETINAALDKAVGDIIANAQGAKSAAAAVEAVLDGVANEARVYREDGPTLEAFIEKLDAAKGQIAAAVVSR